MCEAAAKPKAKARTKGKGATAPPATNAEPAPTPKAVGVEDGVFSHVSVRALKQLCKEEGLEDGGKKDDITPHHGE